MERKQLTLDDVTKRINYNKQTGEFVWMINSGKGKVGMPAGNIWKEPKSKKSYLQIRILGKTYYAHRLAWFMVYNEWPKDQIDHVNGNGLDNSFKNLRSVSRSENMKNQRKPASNKSGFCGVCWDKRLMKWHVKIGHMGDSKHIGVFINKQDAIDARVKANMLYGFHPNHGSERNL